MKVRARRGTIRGHHNSFRRRQRASSLTHAVPPRSHTHEPSHNHAPRAVRQTPGCRGPGPPLARPLCRLQAPQARHPGGRRCRRCDGSLAAAATVQRRAAPRRAISSADDALCSWPCPTLNPCPPLQTWRALALRWRCMLSSRSWRRFTLQRRPSCRCAAATNHTRKTVKKKARGRSGTSGRPLADLQRAPLHPIPTPSG